MSRGRGGGEYEQREGRVKYEQREGEGNTSRGREG